MDSLANANDSTKTMGPKLVHDLLFYVRVDLQQCNVVRIPSALSQQRDSHAGLTQQLIRFAR
jgi:hypothetical protein